MTSALANPWSRADCAELDRKDPLAPLRDLFALPDGVIYLDGNSLGAMPKATAARVGDAVVKEWGQGLIRSWNDAGWIDLPARVGSKIARLVGAQPDDLLATDSTSVNLFKVLAAALSIQAQAEPGRRTIVSERGNFPTDLYIAEGLCALLGGEKPYTLELIDDEAGLAAALLNKPAVVMLTQVDYRTGRMHDMADTTRRIHDAGALAVWDLAHSAGAVPVALDQSGADFAVGCGYKYLNGGPGAPAFVWTAKRHQNRAQQPLSGWFGHAEPFRFEASYRAAAGVTRYLAGTPSVLGMVALDAGLDSVLAAEPVGGMSAIRQKSEALAALFIDLVDASPVCRGLQLVTPRTANERGSQVSFAAGSALGDGYALMSALIERGVIGDFRAPNILRFGFTPLYLRFVDVFDAVAIMIELIERESWKDQRFSVRACGDMTADNTLPEGAKTDFSADMSYGDYLDLKRVLNAQHPRSIDHNEMLFIIQHQTSELWIKLMLHELRAAISQIANNELPSAFKMMARVSRIFEQLVHSWDVLSTMTPSEYTKMRPSLGASSGFQSHQYREIEFLLGNKNSATMKVHKHHPETYAILEASLNSPSLYDESLRLLARRGFDLPASERDFSQQHQPSADVEAAWLEIYRHPEKHWDLYQLAEELIDIEDAFRQWRFRHVTTVERIIGFKPGTGGTAGVSYLRKMLDVVLFPELWKVRTDL